MSSSQVDGNLHVAGRLTAETMTLANDSVRDASIPSDAKIDATKLRKLVTAHVDQPGSGATQRRVVHFVRGATATVLDFKFGCRTIPGAATTFTFDFYKNGASILTGVGTLDNTDTNFAIESCTLASPNLVVGDVLEVVMVLTGVNPPVEPFAHATIHEDPS